MKDRILSGVIMTVLAIWSLFAVPICFYLTNQALNREFYVLMGSWAVHGTEIESGIQTSLTAERFVQDQLTQTGTEFVEQAGYGQSARRLILRGYFGGGSAILTLIYVVNLLLVLLVFWLHMKDVRRGTQLEEKTQMLIKRVEAMQAERERQMQEIEEYEGNLYHQWKTPLTSLNLCLELLQESRSEADRARALEGAKFQTDKLSRLTRLLLREKQISSRKVRFHYELVSLEGVVAQAIQQLELAAHFRGISLSWTPPEDECAVICDEVWITECVVAILENAVEYAQSNSTVTLLLKKQAGGVGLQVCSSSQSKKIDCAQMFRRFTSSSPGHFGIGLHMAKSVTESLHGSIRARATVSGVLVELFLPDLHDAGAYDVTVL